MGYLNTTLSQKVEGGKGESLLTRRYISGHGLAVRIATYIMQTRIPVWTCSIFIVGVADKIISTKKYL